jgi:prolyl-tRNA synthetase
VVGHIYQLGTKYSSPLEATFQDEDGTSRPYVMGCYGIGISRIVAAVVEQHHDEFGIVWPRSLAPFQVVIVVANADDEAVSGVATRIHDELTSSGVTVLLDDRGVAAGVKFKDADLIGYPVQVVVGKRGLAAGTIDLKLRATGERSQAPQADAVAEIRALLDSAP